MNLQQTEIADRLKAGDAAAWQHVCREFAPEVWRFVARRMLGKSAANVADVVQETMFAAARSANNFDPQRGTIWNWLRGIAKNQIALSFRDARRHDILERSANELLQTQGRLAKWLSDTSDLPEDVLGQKETAELVHGVLEKLPEDYSDLLTAKYLDEHSVEQIATARGMTAVSVQSKLARARKAFKEHFQTNQKMP